MSSGEFYCSQCGVELSKRPSVFFDRTQTLSIEFRRLKRGDVLAQRYEVIEELGSGAKGKDLRRIDKKHGVAYILDGDVQQNQDRIQGTVQLIDVQDGTYIWAEVYDWSSSAILQIQSDIAEKVAEALKRKFSSDSWNNIKNE